jgi:hypothetical protein
MKLYRSEWDRPGMVYAAAAEGSGHSVNSELDHDRNQYHHNTVFNSILVVGKVLHLPNNN